MRLIIFALKLTYNFSELFIKAVKYNDAGSAPKYVHNPPKLRTIQHKGQRRQSWKNVAMLRFIKIYDQQRDGNG